MKFRETPIDRRETRLLQETAMAIARQAAADLEFGESAFAVFSWTDGDKHCTHAFFRVAHRHIYARLPSGRAFKLRSKNDA